MVIAAAAMLAPLCAGGCNYVAAATYLVHGPEKTDALYAIPEGKTAVVFVDDRAQVTRQRAVRELIAKNCEETLLAEKAVTDMVEGRLAIAAAKAEKAGKLMTIEQIGRSVKADLVIYANIEGFTLRPDGQTNQPVAVLAVKVVDSGSGERLWPGPDAGPEPYRLTVRFKERSSATPATFGEELMSEQEFAKSVGERLAQVFYKHVSGDRSGDNLSDRRPK